MEKFTLDFYLLTHEKNISGSSSRVRRTLPQTQTAD